MESSIHKKNFSENLQEDNLQKFCLSKFCAIQFHHLSALASQWLNGHHHSYQCGPRLSYLIIVIYTGSLAQCSFDSGLLW